MEHPDVMNPLKVYTSNELFKKLFSPFVWIVRVTSMHASPVLYAVGKGEFYPIPPLHQVLFSLDVKPPCKLDLSRIGGWGHFLGAFKRFKKQGFPDRKGELSF